MHHKLIHIFDDSSGGSVINISLGCLFKSELVFISPPHPGRGVGWWVNELLANGFKHLGLFPSRRHLLGTSIIYLFIQQNNGIIPAALQHKHTARPHTVNGNESFLILCCCFFLSQSPVPHWNWASALGHTLTPAEIGQHRMQQLWSGPGYQTGH